MGEYDDELQFIPGKNNVVADALSRLPVPLSPDCVVRTVASFSFDPFGLIPVQATNVARASKSDRELSLAISYTINGWPRQVQEAMVPFHRIRSELNVEHGCLLWSCRVIIPVQFRSQLLQELHTSRSCVSRMKSVARSIFWWPGLDNDIVQLASDCGICQHIANRLVKEEVHH